MTDVVAQERPAGAAPTWLSRVRCAHCAMPLRGRPSACWSCGLDPAASPGLPAPPPEPVRAPKNLRVPGQARLLVAVVALGLVVLAGCVTLLGSPGDGRGVRSLASRIRGDAWQRADLQGASAQFPARPNRLVVPAGAGLPAPAQALSATSAGSRVELLVADMAEAGTVLDPSAAAEQLVTAFATRGGGRVVRQSPHSGDLPGIDARVEGSGGTTRIRVAMAGTTGYLLAVTGSVEAFDHFIGSFRTAPVPAGS